VLVVKMFTKYNEQCGGRS